MATATAIRDLITRVTSGEPLSRELAGTILGDRVAAVSEEELTYFEGLLRSLPDYMTLDEKVRLVAETVGAQLEEVTTKRKEMLRELEECLPLRKPLSLFTRSALGVLSDHHERVLFDVFGKGKLTIADLAECFHDGERLTKKLGDDAVTQVRLAFRTADVVNRTVRSRAPDGLAFREVCSLPTKNGPFEMLLSNEIELAQLSDLEPDTIGWLDTTLTPESVLLDVGANIGVFSLFAAKSSGGARVISFEPAPANFARLCENIAQNPGLAVEPFPLALADRTKIDRFGVSFSTLAGASSHQGLETEGREWAAVVQRIGCMTMTLDEFCAANEGLRPTHLKIDVDGPELRVLAGAARTLAAAELRHVLVEYRDAVELAEGTAVLGTFGFRCVSTATETVGNSIYEKR